MDSYFFDLGFALWLGILTSLSPCPMATNIAAISFIGRQFQTQRSVFGAGIFYMVGRTLTYIILGAILVTSTQSVPFVAMFLQKYMLKIIGPVLVVVGIILLGIIKFSFQGGGFNENVQKRLATAGWTGSLSLGMLFALSFCPPAAAIFFGSLFSLALKQSSKFIIPALYGIGTALPVLVFAFVIAFSTNRLGVLFNRLSTFEKWARKITAIIFIVAGIYVSLKSFGLVY